MSTSSFGASRTCRARSSRSVTTIARGEAAGTAAMARETKTRAKLVDTAARDRVRATQRADADVRRALQQGTRAAEQAAKAEVRAAESAARDKVRAAQKADAEIRRLQAQSVREAERAEARMAADAAKWRRQRESEQRKSDAANKRVIGAVAGTIGSGARAGLSRVAAATQGVASTVLGIGGGFSVADSVQRSSAIAGMSADIANSGWMPNTASTDANHAKRSSRSITGAARAVAVKTGTSTSEVLEGLQEFVGKSGDLDTGLKVMDQLAVLSRATGASFKDVSSAAGDLMSQLGDMPNKSEAVMTIMRGIAGQGKLGAVEMRNMASQMAKLASSAGQFGGNAVDNILKMGMLAQEARAGGGAASATMAATAVTGFTNTLKTPARIKEFKAQGIDIFDKDKMLNDPTKIIMQSLQKTGGDPEAMKKLFANIMGERAVGSYANAYRHAEAKQKGSGTGVVQGMFDRQLSGATMSKAEVAKAYSDRMQESDAQMASLREKFDQAVEEKLIPKFLELVPVLEKIIPVFIDLQAQALPTFVELIKTIASFVDQNKSLISDLAAHPVGTIIAAELSKSIAAAALPAVLSKALSSSLGQAGLVIGTAAIAIQAGMIAIDQAYKSDDERREGGKRDSAEAATLQGRIARGEATPQDQARAKELTGKLQADAATAADSANNPGFIRGAGRAVAGIIAPEAVASERAQQQREVDGLMASFRALKAATDAATASVGGAAPGTAGAAPNRTVPISQRAAK